MTPKGRYRKLSDRQVDIIRLINLNLGTRTLGAILGLNYRIIRHIRQSSHAYAYAWPLVDDNLIIEAKLLEYFTDLVLNYDKRKI